MAQYRRSEIVSGAFIVLALIVFSLFAFKVGGLNLFGFLDGDKKTFQTMLPDVQTLEVGAKVAIGGRRVGRVTRIEFASDADVKSFEARFEPAWGTSYDAVESATESGLYETDRPPKVSVWFEIDQEPVEAGAAAFELSAIPARAVLLQEGFLGPHYLQIRPGPMPEEIPKRAIFSDAMKGHGVDDDSAIPLVGVQTDLFASIGAKAGPLMESIAALADKLEKELLSADNIAAFSRILTELEGTLVDARKLMNERVSPLLDPENPDGLKMFLMEPARKLIDDTDLLVVDLRTQLTALINDKVNPLMDEASATLQVAKSTLATAETALNEMSPKLKEILDNVAKGTKDLDVRLNNIEGQVNKVVGELMTLLEETNGMVGELRPETLETMQTLRRTMWEAHLLARKLRANPAVLIWGDDEKVLHTLPKDSTGRRRTGRAAPYSQRDENEKK